MNIHSYNISPFQREQLLFSHVRDNPQPLSHQFHLHDFTEIFIYVSGDIDFLVNDRYVSMEPGDILILKRNIIHKPIIKSDANYERIYLGIPDGVLAEMDNVEDPLQFLKGEQYLLKPGKGMGEQICKLAQQIHNAIEWDQPGKSYLCFSYVLQIFHLLELTASESTVDWLREGSIGSALIRKVLSYMNENMAEVSGVQELAERFNVNPSYLSNLFSTEMNVTLKQYIIVRKVSMAKNMLSAGRSVSETAYECGFSSTSHFISTFRKITGQTPGTYQSNRY